MPGTVCSQRVIPVLAIALVMSGTGAGGHTTPDGSLSLSLPIACKIGETCFVQNYVDVDPGPGVRDYMCGSATYQAHAGTDFRLTRRRSQRCG